MLKSFLPAEGKKLLGLVVLIIVVPMVVMFLRHKFTKKA